MSTFQYLSTKVQEAIKGGVGDMSISEALTCALALNRWDWLSALGYTIPDALGQIDEAWIAMIPRLVKNTVHRDQAFYQDQRVVGDGMTICFSGAATANVEMHARLLSLSFDSLNSVPTFVFDVSDAKANTIYRIRINVSTRDFLYLTQHIHAVSQFVDERV